MTIDVGIIGGTGVGSRLAELGGRPIHFPTPYGLLRGRVFEHEGRRIMALQRHAAGPKLPPHRIAYRAIAWGLARLGARACFASAAVGSLRPEWPPGTLVVCSDFLDLTGRRLTLHSRRVFHQDMTHPFPARDLLLEACRTQGEDAIDGGVYVCGDGPRYETPQEIRTMSGLGGDVVGMTAASEAILLREAGVPYACLAVVTNLAAGLQARELFHGEVEDVMKGRGAAVVGILLAAAAFAEPDPVRIRTIPALDPS